MFKQLFSIKTIVALIVINLLLITVALQPDFLQKLEYSSYDFALSKARGNNNSTQQIVIINIDHDSVQQLGQWPWNRVLLATMLDKLREARAKAIGLQVPLYEPTRPYQPPALTALQDYIEKSRFKRKQRQRLKQLLARSQQQFDTDQQLANSIRRAPNVILSLQTDYHAVTGQPLQSLKKLRISGDKHPNIPVATSLRLPWTDFYKNARAAGHNIFYQDVDERVRSQPLLLNYQNNLIPSFALALAARSRGIPLSSLRAEQQGIKLGKRHIATHSSKTFYPVLQQPAFQEYSFYQVLNGDIERKAFRNKTIIIAPAQELESHSYQGSVTRLSQAQLNAGIISSLLDENYFTRPDWATMVEAIILIAILLYLFFIIPNFTTQITLPVTLLLLALIVAINQYFLLVEHIWLQMLTSGFVLSGGHALFGLYHRLSAGKRRFQAEAAEAMRMLVTALQSQGQIDMAMEKLRSIRKIDAAVLGLAYSIAQDYESKRQYGKAISVYDFILNHDKHFRDTAERKQRAQKADNAVLVKSSGSILTDSIDTVPTLGHYEVEKEIGRGAMGVVYLGRDPKINRTVAIKTLSLAEEFEGSDLENVTRRFFKEAEVAGQLNHPNIVTVYDAGQEHDLTYMAMEYLDGHDLTYYIKDKQKPKVDWVLDIVWHVAGALDYAHQQGIVHRDIKPANIMYLPEDGTVKITDFGIARVADSNTTKTGTALGTPSYMSPEQISGERVKGSSDFFSLGVTMYELLTGELPFQGDSLAAMIYQITSKRHKNINQLRKRLPPCVKTIVDKLLQKDPKKRFQDGASIQEAIERCMKR